MLSFLKKLFSCRKKTSENDLELDRMVYFLDYRDHYESICGGKFSKRDLCELFFFRAWTVQFGYRIFSTSPELSEKIIYECVNLYRTLGQGMFEIKNRVNIESELNGDFMELLDQRWQEYDSVVVQEKQEGAIPTRALVGKVLDRMDGNYAFVGLCFDFISQVNHIKELSIRYGLLKSY